MFTAMYIIKWCTIKHCLSIAFWNLTFIDPMAQTKARLESTIVFQHQLLAYILRFSEEKFSEGIASWSKSPSVCKYFWKCWILEKRVLGSWSQLYLAVEQTGHQGWLGAGGDCLPYQILLWLFLVGRKQWVENWRSVVATSRYLKSEVIIKTII